jgi:hypothetical protein
MNTSQTYAQRQQVIKNILSVHMNKITIWAEYSDRYDYLSSHLQDLLNARSRVAKDYYEMVGFESNELRETLIDEFIHINEKIKLILGL